MRDAETERFRGAVQHFIRSFGLLAGDQTPCGEPLAVSHAHALQVLLERQTGGPITQQALAELLGIDKSNVTRLCSKMERSGHIERLRSPSDGRARPLTLTAKGRRVAERVSAASRARFTDVLEALPSAARRQAVIEALECLNGALATLARKGESWGRTA
ncbi:MAG TPA: MarR family winged helix-turn-helix transcriptional regulator [Polyangiaceae bacterium]|jgi:DNA-binding MarR family transcriptional regulator|nr:MarR family winged helix-turn-helix transcriptional regulator [Polyangiaceae bacterium]